MTRHPTWTPHEVKLLREIQNLSQRAFAGRLGYAQSTVVGWEKPQRGAPLQHETIDVLNVDLGRLSPEMREDFDRERGVAAGRLGAGSAARTSTLLATVAPDPGTTLRYAVPDRIDLANLADGDEATFFARHFYLFFADTSHNTLEIFLSHPNWRVRAALAEALGDDTVAVDDTGLTVMARLVQDTDYKVRAATATVIARVPDHAAVVHLTSLLNDTNWHVRERALQGLDRLGLPSQRPALIRTALTIMDTEPAWSRTPSATSPGARMLPNRLCRRVYLSTSTYPAELHGSFTDSSCHERSLWTVVGS